MNKICKKTKETRRNETNEQRISKIWVYVILAQGVESQVDDVVAMNLSMRMKCMSPSDEWKRKNPHGISWRRDCARQWSRSLYCICVVYSSVCDSHGRISVIARSVVKRA